MYEEESDKVSIKIWAIYFVAFFLVICGMFFICNKKPGEPEQIAPVADTLKTREFKMVAVPSQLTSPEERAGYLVNHYWDNFDFSDTVFIRLPDITEQAFVDYLDILSHTEKHVAYTSINTMLDRIIDEDASGKMYTYFLKLYKDYLHDPNSPMRNDEYYIPVANYILEDSLTDEVTKERIKFDLEMMLKNRVGEIATDIAYAEASGKNGQLHTIAGEYILLMFYDPDCPTCKETIAFLKSSPVVDNLLADGILKILTMYTGSGVAEWKKYVTTLPPLWTNGHDKSEIIVSKRLYDLKAQPSLYLLNSEKRILLKDVDVPVIERYLKDNVENKN